MTQENENNISIDDIMKYSNIQNKDDDTENVDKEETDENKIDFIRNPLPVPKRREHVRLDFAIKVDDNDDFDIKDMTGMDFFDYD